MDRTPAPAVARAAIACALLAALGAVRAGAGEDGGPSGPAGSLYGVVVADGEAVGGATVRLLRGVSYPDSIRDDAQVARALALVEQGARNVAIAATTTADARGHFAFDRLAACVCAVEATGTARGKPVVGFAAPVQVEARRSVFAVVQATPPESIAGVVVDAAAKPSRVRVLLSLPDPEGAVHPHAVLRSVETGEDGSFDFPGVPRLSYELTVARPGSRLLTRLSPRVAEPRMAARVVRVVHEGGGPVAGAGIAGECLRASSFEVLAAGRTDAAGEVSLVIPEGAAGILRVSAPGFDPKSFRFEGGRDPIVVSLPAASAWGRIVGRVLDESGAPVAGAAVSAHEAGEGFLVAATAARAVSGPDGRFTLEDVAPGPVWLAAIGAGFVSPRLSDASEPPPPSQVVQVGPAAQVEADVRLVRASRVEGVVVDGDGAPVPGAFVRWHTISETTSHGSDWVPASERDLVAGADGRFAISSAAPRTRIEVEASAAGFVDGSDGADVGPASAPPATVRVVLPRARRATVRVRDAATGLPVEGASVEIRPLRTTTTGADGLAILGPLPPGRLAVEIRHPDHLETPPTRTDASGDVEVEVSLRPGLSIAGAVRDRRGAPVERAMVWATLASGTSVHASAFTEEDGTFRLRALVAGTWNLAVTSGTARADATAEAGASGVVVALPMDAKAARGVVFRVLGADGKPVPLAAFAWRVGDGGYGTAYVVDGRKEVDVSRESDPEGWTVEVRAATDARGKALPFGPARVGPLRRDQREMEIRLPAGRALGGRVSTPSGSGVVGFVVRAYRPAQAGEPPVLGGEATTGADGIFALVNLGEGEHDLVAATEDPKASFGLRSPVRAPAGATGISIQLAARVSATVTVLDAREVPLAGVSVSASRETLAGGESVRARTDEKGRAILEGLVDGATYLLEVSRPRDEGRLVVASVPGWVPHDVTLHPGADPLVRGVVLRADGRPFAGAMIVVEDAGAVATSGPDGTFEVPLPPGGRATLWATPLIAWWADGFADPDLFSPTATVGAGDRGVVLSMPASVSCSWRIEGGAAGAWKDARPSLSRPKAAGAEAGADGTVDLPEGDAAVALPPLVPGARYRLWLPAGTDGRCALVSFVAQEGLVVVVRPAPGAVLSGTARLPDGATIASVTVTGDGSFARASVRPDGAFVVSGLPPGLPVDVVVETRVAGVLWTGRASAAPGTPVSIDLAPAAPK